MPRRRFTLAVLALLSVALALLLALGGHGARRPASLDRGAPGAGGAPRLEAAPPVGAGAPEAPGVPARVDAADEAAATVLGQLPRDASPVDLVGALLRLAPAGTGAVPPSAWQAGKRQHRRWAVAMPPATERLPVRWSWEGAAFRGTLPAAVAEETAGSMLVLTAEAADGERFHLASFPGPAPGETRDLGRLVPRAAATLFLRVDGAAGEPIAGARVALRWGSETSWIEEAGGGVGGVATDAQGRAAFAVAGDVAAVVVAGKGYAPAYRPLVRVSETSRGRPLCVVLHEGATLVGQVERERPAPAYRCRLRGEVEHEGGLYALRSVPFVLDEDGRFEIAGLGPGEYWLELEAGRYRCRATGRVTVPEGAGRIDAGVWSLARTATLRLTAPEGSASEIGVVARCDEALGPEEGPTFCEATLPVGEDGRAAPVALPAGTWDVVVTAGGVALPHRKVVLPAGGEVEIFLPALEEGRRHAVRVVGPEPEAPFAGRDYRMVAVLGGARLWTRSGKTDARGGFTMPALERAAAYELTLLACGESGSEHVWRGTGAALDTGPIDLSFARRPLGIRVVDPSGAPIPDLYLSLRSKGDLALSDAHRMRLREDAWTDEAGRADFPDVPMAAPDLAVWVRVGGVFRIRDHWDVILPLTAGAGARGEVVDLRLEGYAVRGTARDATGRPLAQRSVFLLSADGEAATADVVTDTAGGWRIDLVGAGRWVLALRNPEGGAVLARSRAFAVPPSGAVDVGLEE